MKTLPTPMPFLSAPAYAAILLDLGICTSEQISIHTATETEPGKETTITEAGYEEADGKAHIWACNESASQQRFLEQTDIDSPARAVYSCLEEQAQGFRLALEMKKRKLEVGVTSAVLGLLPEERFDHFTVQQRCILVYFGPLATFIRADLTFLQTCLEWITSQRVVIEEGDPPARPIPPQSIPPLGRWQLNANARLGGIVIPDKKFLLIKVGPLPVEKIAGFVASGEWYRFLNEAFLPMLLSPDYEWHLTAAPEKDKEKWLLSGGNYPSFLGINTAV
ncbi:MAG: type VI secretion system baseplate subunit TssG [Lewinellaceae bacterium]|nr:type VI secretion system baseplate subunit TssG [Lewinellaceae bacterium]